MNMKNFIQHFSEISLPDASEIGGKGANLATLIATGFSVPVGFCITTQAYREFLKTFGLAEQITAKIAAIDLSVLENIRTCGAVIRHLIEEHTIPDGIQQAILTAFQELYSFKEPTPIPSQADSSLTGKPFVAVRSSATAEDLPDLSFAGQHDTYLNISGESDLLFYVKKCWASLWSDRAIAYRHKNHIDHQKVLMAVVVQQMATATVSGILFTANPVTQNRQECLINANWGLGESVVSGKVSPDEYIVDKERLFVTRRTIAEKTLMITLGAKGAVEIPVPIEQQRQPCLADAQIHELTVIGKQIEAHFGTPQDIEWGLADKHLYILQSRPITTLQTTSQTVSVIWSNQRTRELLQETVVFWSNWNFRETMPYPLPPLSWSYWMDLWLPVVYGEIGGLKPQSPLRPYLQVIDLVYGRVYWNMNVFYGMPFFGQMFRSLLPHVDHEAGKLFQTLYARGELQPLKSPKGFASLWFLLFNTVRIGLGSLLAPWLITPSKVQQYWQDACAFAQLDLQDKSSQELLARMRAFNTRTIKTWIPGFLLMGHAFIGCVGLAWCIKAWPDVSLDQLLAGIPGNKTTEGALELYQLSQMPDAMKQIFLTHPIAEIPARLETSAEGRAFLQRLQQFLALYGHRTPKEFDIATPRWEEDPTFVCQMIKNYLQVDGQDTNPLKHFQQIAAERERLTELMRQRLSQGWLARIFPLKKWLFNAMVLKVNRYMPWRENPKYYVLKCNAGSRRILLEIGRRLCADGYLETPEGIYFLTIPELESVCQAQEQNTIAPFDSAQGDGYGEQCHGERSEVIVSEVELRTMTTTSIKNLVRQRQDEWQTNLKIDPPFVVRSDEQPVAYAEELPSDARILHGTPVSRGKVTGKARIILDPAEGAAFNKGEILVAPYTDPGWTPLFLTAKALVMEVGGVMCHGAVVAREYGIPSVVGVKQATKLIKTGDEITVDGNQGRIFLT
jgi:phosphohistidine swiveling domain-containing protein